MTKISKLFIIFLLAAILRLFFVFEYPQIPVESDASRYDWLGWNLMQGKGFITFDGKPEIKRSPGYPFFLAIIYKMFSHSYNYVKLIQILISLFTLILTFFLAKDIFGYKIAFFTTTIASIYPPFLSYNALLLTECLFTFCIVLFVYLFLLNLRRRKWSIYFILGLVGGFTVLIREEFIVFLPVYSILGLIYFKENLKKILLLLLVALAVIVPWTIRNYIVFNKFIFVSSQSANIFWLSTYKEELLEWYCDSPHCKSAEEVLPNVEKDGSLLRQSIKNIRDHPFLYIKFCFKRFFRFWIGSHSNTFYGLQDSLRDYIHNKDYFKVAIKTFLLIFNTTLILFGFCGIITAIRKIYERRRKIIIALLVPILIIMLVHFFLFATLRYQVPIMPFMIIFASYIIVCFWNPKQIENIFFIAK